MDRPRSFQGNKVVLFIVLLLIVSFLVTVALGVAWSDELQKIPTPPSTYDPARYGLPPIIAGYRTFAVLTADNTACMMPGEKRLILQATQANVQDFLSASSNAAIQQDLQQRGFADFAQSNVGIVGPGTTLDQFLSENEKWNEDRKTHGCVTSVPAEPHISVSVTPTATQPLHHIIEPLVTATRLRFDSWSPDGNWIAYWQGESEDRPAHLAFVDTRSGSVCQHENLTSGFWDGYAIWQDNGRVLVMLNQGKDVFRGTPCGRFDPVRDYALPEEDGDVSPDGRYRADTVTKTKEQLIHNVTTITELKTGKTVANIAWDASVHALQSGPRWLNDERYLLGQTLNQGVLYVELPYGRTGDMLTDLFGLGAKYDKSIWHVFSYTDPVAGTYHILLQWDGGPVRSPILLYHSELKKVEELAFYETHPFGATDHEPLDFFSPDGKWLLVSNPINKECPSNAIGEDYWLQPIDLPGNEVVTIAGGLAAGKTTWEAQKMALYDRQSIYIFSLPDGGLLGRWAASRFALIPAGWSPDGKQLAALGLPWYDGRDALFIIEP